jgi:NADH-quinone oxidoreductase subunit L
MSTTSPWTDCDRLRVLRLGWLLVALPLLGAAVLLLGGRRTDSGATCSATRCRRCVRRRPAAVHRPARSDAEDRSVSQHLFSWIPAGSFQVDVGLLLDPLSMCFVLLVTFVGPLIHVYSIGYMEHDVDRRRFFGYLNLFVAAMLPARPGRQLPGALRRVGGASGLASYLLIGFWNFNSDLRGRREEAFVAEPVGDFGLSSPIMIMFAQFGGHELRAGLRRGRRRERGHPDGDRPDAAARRPAASPPSSRCSLARRRHGRPHPVSALIHAATHGDRGRLPRRPVGADLRRRPDAATGGDQSTVPSRCSSVPSSATAKDDIKKALAASTMSQIGYMMLAAGLGPVGYAFAIFHLLTHGFFKA